MAVFELVATVSLVDAELIDEFFDYSDCLGGYVETRLDNFPPDWENPPEGYEFWHLFYPLKGEPNVQLDQLREAMASFNDAYSTALELKDWRLTEEQDWRVSWRSGFPPRRLGERILLCPPWEVLYETGRETIVVEPGQAFGTGLHETTQSCVSLLEEILTPGAKILDIGCGSGILTLAAKALGAGEALGIDLDLIATAEAAHNTELSGLGPGIAWRCQSGGEPVPGTYDVVLANMLFHELQLCLPTIERALAPEGAALFSGITLAEEPQARQWLASSSLAVERTRPTEVFTTWLVRRAASRRSP